jgi:hypothetical protein
MNDRFSDSFISPLKHRFAQIFNTSSSGDNPQRNPYSRTPKNETQDSESGNWERESQNFFDDFISLDEEKITRGLSQAEARRAFDKKFRQSRSSEQLAEETEALLDAFKTSTIDPAITREKLLRVATFLQEVARLFQTRYATLHGHFELFSLPTLELLKAAGFQDKYLKFLIYIGYYHHERQEFLNNPAAHAHTQLTLHLLGVPVPLYQLEGDTEKYLIDLASFQSLLDQTLHYIELNLPLFEGVEVAIRERSLAAQPYFLKRLQREGLNLHKRLARKHLDNRYRRVRSNLQLVAKQLAHLDQQQSPVAHLLGEKAPLIQAWQSMESDLASTLALHEMARGGFPIPASYLADHLIYVGVDPQQPALQKVLRGFSLEQLTAWQKPVIPAEPWPRVFPVLTQATPELQQAVQANDLAAQDKWSLLKAQLMAQLTVKVLDPTQEQLALLLKH